MTKLALVPILSNAYWFMTCYVGLMILEPVLNMLFNDKTIKQLTVSIAVIYIVLTIYPFPYFRQLATEVGAGRSLQHFIVLYLTGGLLKRVTQAGVSARVSRIAKSACIIAFSVTVLSRAVLPGNANLQAYDNVFFTNNSPTIYLCASMVCLLVMNTKVNCSEATRRTIELLARSTLAVYLLHDGVLRTYLWDNIQRLLIGRMHPVLLVLVLPVLIYILCTILDQPRVYSEKKIKKLRSRPVDWSK